MLLNPYRFGAAPGGSDFYSLLMAQGPVNYWRNAESSGSVMSDEVAAAGTYVSSPTLGKPALYPGAGALTTVEFNGGNYATSNAVPASLTAMTLITIVRPTNLSGFHVVGPQRDTGTGLRKYQWRTNGAVLEFVKIVGGVAVSPASGTLAINTTYLLSVEIDVSGNCTQYINGAPAGSMAIGAADYGGGGGEPWTIGFASGAGAVFIGTTGENAVLDHVPGATFQSALFAATGL